MFDGSVLFSAGLQLIFQSEYVSAVSRGGNFVRILLELFNSFGKQKYLIFFSCSFNVFRDSIATTQMVIKRENDYDASTDEESENPARASLPSGKTEGIVFV